MNKNMNLSEGKLLPSLLKFTIPILFSMLLQVTYGTVDLLIVSQFSSVGDVSAVTIGSQFMQTVTTFCTGLSMGTTILLGQYIGANQKDKTGKVVGVSVLLFTILAVVITLLLTVFSSVIVDIMNTPAEAISQACSYLTICAIGSVFIVAYNLLGSVFRGIGDSHTPFIAVLIACIVNIVLDLFFVAVLDMGAAGAAYATVIAQASSVAISLLLISKKPLPFAFSRANITLDKDYTKRILKLGVPVALQSTLVGVSFLVVTAIVNKFGVTASAAVGIVEKITGLIMLVPLSFMQSLSVFTAQSIGANKHSRAKRALFYSIAISLSFGVVMAYLSAFHGTIFTNLFIDDPLTTASALLYLKSYSFDVVLVCFIFSFTGYFNGCGKTSFVMIQAVLGAFLVRIPLAFYFSILPDTNLFIIGLATPISTALQIIMCMVYYARYQKTTRYTNKLSHT